MAVNSAEQPTTKMGCRYRFLPKVLYLYGRPYRFRCVFFRGKGSATIEVAWNRKGRHTAYAWFMGIALGNTPSQRETNLALLEGWIAEIGT